jgi:hypothetical protein
LEKKKFPQVLLSASDLLFLPWNLNVLLFFSHKVTGRTANAFIPGHHNLVVFGYSWSLPNWFCIFLSNKANFFSWLSLIWCQQFKGQKFP